jgi:hypothetical protein
MTGNPADASPAVQGGEDASSPDGDGAWAVLLPGGAGLPRGHWKAGARALLGLRPADPGGPQAYVAVPSRERPMIVASCDATVLRYLANTVLSVPPGTGPVLSMLLTPGLKLFRYRLAWLLAAALRVPRASGVVLTSGTSGTGGTG